MEKKMIGLDVGTSFLIASTKKDDKEVYNMQRDCYFVIPEDKKKAIKIAESSGGDFIYNKDRGEYYLIGQDAINFVNLLSTFMDKEEVDKNRMAQLKRPMAQGVLNPKDKLGAQMLEVLIEGVVEGAVDDILATGEGIVYFSVPADPVDGEFNTIFHASRIEQKLEDLGYVPHSLNEGLAVIYSEAPSVEVDGESVPFSGLGISCLCPGTKIYTDRGILFIEDVEVGDSVITHNGRWKKIENVITKDFSGKMTKIQITGYSNNTEEYKFVDNHELYVKKDNMWQWIGCEEVEEKDIVGEPIIKRNRDAAVPFISLYERITSSNTVNKKSIEVTPDIQRFMGYFLGDGSICERESGIQVDFSIEEEEYASDFSEILEKNFNKNSTHLDKDGEGKVIRVKCYSKGLAKWMRKYCYDKNGEKVYPWDLAKLKYSDCLNLLAGLIRSDGWISGESIEFGNTSTNLIILVKQLFSRVGFPASINYRLPRDNEKFEIYGNKEEWCVSTSGKKCISSLKDNMISLSCQNSHITERIFIEDGFCCGKIQKIEKEEYSGIVYDLQVEDDHSFSGPFMTMHNCGGGMVNVCFAYRGMALLEYSTSRAGDWIDEQVAQVTNTPISVVTRYKEEHLDLSADLSSDEMLNALYIFYDNLIKYVLHHLKRELSGMEDRIDYEVPVVLAGGTSKPKGFVELFKKRAEKENLPFKIKEVVTPSEPSYAVSKGCLVAALADESEEEEMDIPEMEE